MNLFTFRFAREAVREKPGNVCVSPLSISVCLSTLLNGSKGKTFETLRTALGYQSADLGAIDVGIKSVIDQLVDAPNKPFTISNSVWLRSEFKPNPGYQTSMKDFFGADFFSVPAFNQTTVDKINAWTKQKTKNRIPKIVDRVDPQTALALVNALTFDADWETQFEPRSTSPQKFTLAGGKVIQPPTMHASRDVPYGESALGQAVRLDYKGGAYGMILVLPKGTPGAFFAGLNAKSYGVLLNSLKANRETSLMLPKFKVEDQYDLRKPLSQLGMGSLFVAGDFTGVSSTLHNTRIGEAVHKTYLKLNEKGTEAAAATAIMVPTRAVANPAQFRADRPFAYLLVNNKTDVIVFAGVCADPR